MAYSILKWIKLRIQFQQNCYFDLEENSTDFLAYCKGNGTFKKCTYLWQPLPCWLNEKCVYLKLLEAPPLFIPQADSYWPSTWPSLMRKFLNIRGCLTHILALNQPSCSHLYHQGPTAVTYSRGRWHILLLPCSPGWSTRPLVTESRL